MSAWSAAKSVRAYNAAAPKFGDVSSGFAYAIILSNQTAADITGDVTFDSAPADAADPCKPGPWSPLLDVPECDDVPGAVTAPAKVTFTAQAPLAAGTQCAIAVPCPQQFIRATAPANIDVILVVTRLRRNV
jgi:hypothetical protein